MLRVDRGLFFPPAYPYPERLYEDAPQPIGFHVTISAPHMHAAVLSLLRTQLKPGARALDIGSGSGYLVACLAALVGPEGTVIGVERIPELVERSLGALRTLDFCRAMMDRGHVAVVAGDGHHGYAAGAEGFDAVHVGAAATEVPRALVEQLRPGGRLVVPVGPQEGAGQQLIVVDKAVDGRVTAFSAMDVRYVPLIQGGDAAVAMPMGGAGPVEGKAAGDVAPVAAGSPAGPVGQ